MSRLQPSLNAVASVGCPPDPQQITVILTTADADDDHDPSSTPQTLAPCTLILCHDPHVCYPLPLWSRLALRRAAANLPWVDVLPQEGANVYSILQRDMLVRRRAVRKLTLTPGKPHRWTSKPPPRSPPPHARLHILYRPHV